MALGPAPLSRAERLRLAQAIAARAAARHGPDLKAVGLYGSMARGTDGPYSDIEMYCILRQPDGESTYEWVAGAWKAEVHFFGEDVLLAEAAEVEGRWPLTHGSLHDFLPLYDPEGYFARLRSVAGSRTADQFHAAIEGVLTGEMYEFVGKLRNLSIPAYLPQLAVKMAEYGAYLIGLHNRLYYSTGSRVLTEALTFPHRPDGFDELTGLVMAGTLSEQVALADACERFWAGVVAWAEAHGYRIVAEQEIPF